MFAGVPFCEAKSAIALAFITKLNKYDYIKNHIADVDAVLTDDDIKALHDAESDLKTGKTKRLI